MIAPIVRKRLIAQRQVGLRHQTHLMTPERGKWDSGCEDTLDCTEAGCEDTLDCTGRFSSLIRILAIESSIRSHVNMYSTTPDRLVPLPIASDHSISIKIQIQIFKYPSHERLIARSPDRCHSIGDSRKHGSTCDQIRDPMSRSPSTGV